MCWSLEVSLGAAVYGFAVSLYLHRRNYSKRDKWYALFLATFTSTQLFDAVFWYLKGESDDVPCVATNLVLSKYLLPPVLFFQPWVLTLYPSTSWTWLRGFYRILTAVGCIVMVALYECTSVLKTSKGKYPTLLWGGAELPTWLVDVGIGFWALGAALFVSPFRYALQILLVGGCVLALLVTFDGTYDLLSKMCTYCLLLSIVWSLEPIWTPPSSAAERPHESTIRGAVVSAGSLLYVPLSDMP